MAAHRQGREQLQLALRAVRFADGVAALQTRDQAHLPRQPRLPRRSEVERTGGLSYTARPYG